MSENETEQSGGIGMHLQLWPIEGDRKMALTQVVLGGKPLILIDPEFKDNGDVILNVDASGFEDPEDLAGALEEVVELLRSDEFRTVTEQGVEEITDAKD